MKRLWVIAWVLLFAASAARADFVIYRQDFNGYADGTAVTTLQRWYSGAGNVPFINAAGKAELLSGSPFSLFLDMTDIFGYGNKLARIEFDAYSSGENNFFISPGDAFSLEQIRRQAMGLQHGDYGTHYLYHWNGPQGWDYGGVVTTNSFHDEYHYVFDIAKSVGQTTQITWNVTFSGHPWIPPSQGDHSFTMSDERGLNTMRWYSDVGTASPWSSLDNVVITAIGVAKPRQATVIIVR